MSEATQLRTDKTTLKKLHTVVEMPLTRWLRLVASGELVVVPRSLNERLTALEQTIQELSDNLAEFDEAWYKSFRKHEHDVAYLGWCNLVTWQMLEQRLAVPGLADNLAKSADGLTEKNWQEPFKGVSGEEQK